MVNATNKGLVNWKYGDWRRMPSLNDQIDRLIRHIEEVEKYAFESQDKGRRLTMHQNMLSRLEGNLEQLLGKQSLQASPAAHRLGRVSRFRRGTSS
ncbi:MAG: hypothetical protein ABJZ55_02055 [Fuerstiella sp.]